MEEYNVERDSKWGWIYMQELKKIRRKFQEVTNIEWNLSYQLGLPCLPYNVLFLGVLCKKF